MSFLNKVSEPVGSVGVPGIASGQLAALPALFEYLSGDRYPDGSPRERSTMTVFCEDAVVKLCLSDRDQGRTLWRSARTLEDALLALEGAIQDGTADWRRSGSYKGSVKGKK